MHNSVFFKGKSILCVGIKCSIWVIILILFSVQTALAQFGVDVRVDNAPPGLTFGCVEAEIVCASDGTLYIVWFDDREQSLMQANIFISKSTDGGSTWSQEVKVDDQSTWHQISPSLTLDASNNLYCVWHQMAGYEHIRFSKSTDGGSTWTSSVEVDNAPSGTYIGSPEITCNDNNELLVVWDDNRTGTYQCYFSKSTDGGTSWSTDMQIGGSQGQDPKIQYCGDTLYVVYGTYTSANDIFLTKSIDNGASWQDLGTVHSITTGWQRYADIALGSSQVLYCAWYDWRSGLCEIRCAKTTDGGNTWQSSVVISDTTFYQDYFFGMEMHIVCRGENYITCVWDDYRLGNGGGYYNIIFTMSTDGGNTWLIPNDIVNDTIYGVSQRYPTLCLAQNGNPCVAFSDNRLGTIYLYFDRADYSSIQETTQGIIESVNLYSFPNPFHTETSIHYSVPSPGRATLKIYDVSGKLVKTLLDEKVVPGKHTCVWFGDDNSGKMAAEGVYFLRYEMDNQVTARKILMIR